MSKYFISTALLATALCCTYVEAQAPLVLQDHNTIQIAAEKFLTLQTNNRNEKIKISVNKPDSRLKLQHCDQLTAFLPPSSKLVGRTTVGIRCDTPKNWTLYLSANVQIFGNYVVAATGLSAGQILEASDLAVVEGEISQLPASTLTEITQAVGQAMATNMTAGSFLRKESLRAQAGVTQGQSVRVIVKGNGFQVTAEGRALQTSADGQLTNVRLANGQTLSGVAKKGGYVEVTI